MKTHHSVPKLMTFMNCSPGTTMVGEKDGQDNVVLADYFKRSADFDIMDISDLRGTNTKTKTDEKMISYSFLGYMNAAIDELHMRPRRRTELFRSLNPKDIDVCRNSFICNDTVGISHRFPNKSFSTNDVPIHTTPGENWGVFVYNNNCGIEPGTDISKIKEIQHFTLKNKDGKVDGLDFDLTDIISGLTKKYGLTEDDYLFLFDYSCNNFSNKTINPGDDPRLIRRLARSTASDFGFGKKKRGTRKPGKKKKNNKKRTVRHDKK